MSATVKKIEAGIASLKAMPLRLLSGPTLGYDPETSELHRFRDGTGGYHMVIAFGAPQTWIELAQLIEDSVWAEMLTEFGEFYAASDQEKRRRSDGLLNDSQFHWPMFAASMVAFAAWQRKDPKLAAKAWELLLSEEKKSYAAAYYESVARGSNMGDDC